MQRLRLSLPFKSSRLWTSMDQLRILLLAIFLLCLSAECRAQQFETVSCEANSYSNAAPAGIASITEIALTYSFSSCPTKRLRLEQPIDLPIYAPLYIWLRLQGDQRYLNSPQSAAVIDVRFARHDEGIPVFYDAIEIGAVIRAEALKEVALTGGVFDWRFEAWKVVFDKPGRYRMTISQGSQSICITDPKVGSCDLEFLVR